MTSYLFSFSFHHFSHRSILEVWWGDLLLVLVHSLLTTAAADKKTGKDSKIERDKHAALYMKSATTPVWVGSSERKYDTDGGVCAFDESWRVTGGTESKRTGAEKPFVLWKLLSSWASLIKALQIYFTLLVSLIPVLELRLITFEEELRGEDNKEEHLSVSVAAMWKALEIPAA